MRAGVNAKIVEAFDINDKANDVYQHNFGHRPYQVLSFRFILFVILVYICMYLYNTR